MSRLLAAYRRFIRPRKDQSFFDRLWRNLLNGIFIQQLLCLLFRRHWYDGLGYMIWLSFCYALGEYGYFHVYGGTDEETLRPPISKDSPPIGWPL